MRSASRVWRRPATRLTGMLTRPKVSVPDHIGRPEPSLTTSSSSFAGSAMCFASMLARNRLLARAREALLQRVGEARRLGVLRRLAGVRNFLAPRLALDELAHTRGI